MDEIRVKCLRALRAAHIKLLQEDVTNAGHILAAAYGRVTATDGHLPIRRNRFAVLQVLSLSFYLSAYPSIFLLACKRAADNRTATKYSRKKVTLGNERSPASGDGPPT